ncbi:MAG TPA: hypothetical protein VGK94_04390 [Candidatus Polarisedimenticolia bacterium]|jgi:hypothetical protein
MLRTAGILLCCAAPALAGSGPGSARNAEIMLRLSEMRGHSYRKAVEVETLRQDEVRSFLLRKLGDEYPDERLDAERKAMVHLGLLDRQDDLKELFVAMLSEQAAGYYDPDARRLFLVEGRSFPGMALVHELAHALQDQVFGIAAILDAARPDDDALLAAQAMIEGEATLLTERFLSARGETDEGKAEPMGERTAPEGEPAGTRIPLIPRVLQDSFTFPYVEGLAWARAIDARGGALLMDEIFKRPPESTEQVLHPVRAAAQRDLPSLIATAAIETLPQGDPPNAYRLIHANVMGEFMVRELLGGAGDPAAVTAAEGWDGDRYAIYEGRRGATSMIWVTVWDRSSDAVEFLARASSWLDRRPARGRAWRIGREGSLARIVAIVEGFEPRLADRIIAELEGALPAGVTFR